MLQTRLVTKVRSISAETAVIELRGEMNLYAEQLLMDAFAEAGRSGARVIIFNFAGLEYMNSAGIGLLVTMLIRARRLGQRLIACCLSEHYREIFSITRLDEAFGVYEDEAAAAAAAETAAAGAAEGSVEANG